MISNISDLSYHDTPTIVINCGCVVHFVFLINEPKKWHIIDR